MAKFGWQLGRLLLGLLCAGCCPVATSPPFASNSYEPLPVHSRCLLPTMLRSGPRPRLFWDPLASFGGQLRLRWRRRRCPSSGPAGTLGRRMRTWMLTPRLRAQLADAGAGLFSDCFVLYLAALQPTRATRVGGALTPCASTSMITALALAARARPLLCVRPACLTLAADLRHEVGAPGTAPDGEGLEPSAPDMAAVFAADIPTQRHVPKTARSAWPSALLEPSIEAAVVNSPAAWLHLLLLPTQDAHNFGQARRDLIAMRGVQGLPEMVPAESPDP